MLKKVLLSIFLVVFIGFGQTQLVFHLTFDDGEIKDIIGNKNGVNKGGSFVEGKTGKGYYFDGKERETDCIIFKNLAKEKFFQDFEEGPFSISIWIKPDSSKTHPNQKEILSTGRDIGPGWRLTYVGGRIQFRSGTGKRDEGGYWEVKTIPSIDKVKPDEWNHIVVVRNKEGILSIYLNGKKAGESDSKFDIIPSNFPLTIGAYLSGFAYGFIGAIDEIKIYKGALSSEEILKEYKGGKIEKKIKLDGKLDEDIWKKGKVFTNFYLKNTINLSPVQTKVIFNYDQDNLYFAFICDEPNIEKIKNEIKENSLKVYRDDSVDIMIDADNNKADYYHFLFNPSGYYGGEFRTQSGFVGSEVKDFKLYTGSSIEKDRWIVEVIIPYSSLTLERIKEQISLNFARNRRVDLPSIQESSIGEKGQFNNPDAFVPVKLENIDLSIYAIELRNLEIVDIEKKDEKIGATIKGVLKNLTDKQKYLEIEIVKEGLGVIEKKNLDILPEQEKEFFLSIKTQEEEIYKFEINIKDKERLIYRDVYSPKIEYTPITLELLKPFYRNSIYSTQKLDEIKVKVKIWLKEEEIKEAKSEISIIDSDNKVISCKTDIAKKESFFTLEVPKKEGEYKIISKLIKEGKTIYETNIKLNKLPPAKGNEVYVDENLNLVLNGNPIMPIIWWAEMSMVEEIAKTGADGIIIWPSKKYLDELNKLNLFAEVSLFTVDELKKYLAGKDKLSEEAKENITKKVNSIKDHPALLFYYLVDEPEIRNVGPDILKETYNLIKELDPYHPVQITNDTVKGITTYIECADLFFPDPYIHPLEKGLSKQPMRYIIPFMEEIKRAGMGKKFIGITPQVFDYGKVYAQKPPHSTKGERAPTFVEERCMNYLAIVYGAKGFNYYVYGKREEGHWGAVNIPDLRLGMPYLIREKKSLSKVILLGKNTKEKIIIEDKRIHYSVKELNGKIYIIAVNIEPVELSVEVKVKDNIKKFKVISEKRVIEVKNGIFIDKFMPYDVHIYTDNLDFQDVIDLKEVEEEIKKEGGYYTYRYNI